MQASSSCWPCRIRRFAVQQRRCRASQKKNLTLVGARVFQINLAPNGEVDPMNIVPYADAAEYLWSADQHQMTESCTPGVSWTSRSNSQRSKYYKNSWTVCAPVMSETHA